MRRPARARRHARKSYPLEDRKRQKLIRQVRAERTGVITLSVAHAIAVSRPSGKPRLGVLIRAVRLNEWSGDDPRGPARDPHPRCRAQVADAARRRAQAVRPHAGRDRAGARDQQEHRAPVPACDLFEDGHHAAGNAGADVVEQRAVAGVTRTMAAVPRPACLKHVACSFRVAP